MSEVTPAWKSIPNAGARLSWYKDKGTLRLNLLLSVIYVAQSLNGFDGSLVSGFQAYTSWNTALGNPSSSAIGLLNVGFYVAGLLTAPFTSYVADRYGRRVCVVYAAWCNLLGTVIGTCAGLGHASGYGVFLASRIICGSGFAVALLVCPILLHEVPHPRDRAMMAGFFDCSYSIGEFTCSWVLFGCSYISSNWAWRIPYLLHLPFAIVMAVMIYFVPESPRWLMRKGRDAEALAFMTKYHAMGQENDPLVIFQYEEIRNALETESTVQQSSWKSLLLHRGNRRRMAAVIIMALAANLNGSSVIQYYYTGILKIIGITAQSKVTAIGAGKTTFGFMIGITGLISQQYLRRRTQLTITWIGLIVCNVCLIATCAVYANSPSTDRNLGAGYSAVLFVWLYSAFNNFCSGPIFYVYPAEIVHYAIRARSQTVWTVASKICSIFNAYVNSIALARIAWKYFIVYTVALFLIGTLMYFYIVETKGRTLEEISQAFDGPDFKEEALEQTQQVLLNVSGDKAHAAVTVEETDEKLV